jgi:hypothetical protein
VALSRSTKGAVLQVFFQPSAPGFAFGHGGGHPSYVNTEFFAGCGKEFSPCSLKI